MLVWKIVSQIEIPAYVGWNKTGLWMHLIHPAQNVQRLTYAVFMVSTKTSYGMKTIQADNGINCSFGRHICKDCILFAD